MNVEDIVKLAQISSALEVSGYPKPGNVHRTRDYDDMVFEDFVISGIVIGDAIREACTDVDVENPKLGKCIFDAVKETDRWIHNNTNLGIVMMTTPIAVSAAISESFDELRQNIVKLMNHANPDKWALEVIKIGFEKNNIPFNEENLITLLVTNYHDNGFYFHSFPSVYKESIMENGMEIVKDIYRKAILDLFKEK